MADLNLNTRALAWAINQIQANILVAAAIEGETTMREQAPFLQGYLEGSIGFEVDGDTAYIGSGVGGTDPVAYAARQNAEHWSHAGFVEKGIDAAGAEMVRRLRGVWR